jgi:hypothetical protein
VSLQPPALDGKGNVTQTAEMGRVDSAVGRKMAALDAEKAAKEAKIAEAKAAKQAGQKAVAQATSKPEEAENAAPEANALAAEPKRPRMLTRVWNKMFGS